MPKQKKKERPRKERKLQPGAREVLPLSSTHRKLAKEWHPLRNGTLTPDDVSHGSSLKVWWQCAKDKEHVWEAVIGKRTIGRNCPFCANKRVSKTNSLLACFPEIAAEWHPAKNGKLNPNQVLSKTHKSVWWKCPWDNDHVWSAPVSNRTSQAGQCPFCIGSRVCESNSLETYAPELAAQWHKTKNKSLTPSEVVPGSNKKIWWKCPKNSLHTWQATVGSRALSGRGCPSCAGKKLAKDNNLKALHPEIARQWHPTKNGELTPDSVVAGSAIKIWWHCKKAKDHVWQASVVKRTRGTGCPFCAGNKVAVSNSLAIKNKDLAEEWHKKRNGDLTPSDVTSGSGRKVWWKCKTNKKHVWEAVIASRSSRGHGCPYCSGQNFSVDVSLLSLYPEVAKEWHPKKNGKLEVSEVRAGITLRAWWRCSKSKDHVWQAQINSRTKMGTGCPYCAGLKVSAERSLRAKYPGLAKMWYQARNGDLKPSDVGPSSRKKVWWRCFRTADHMWQATIGNIVKSHKSGSPSNGCPHCLKS